MIGENSLDAAGAATSRVWDFAWRSRTAVRSRIPTWERYRNCSPPKAQECEAFNIVAHKDVSSYWRHPSIVTSTAKSHHEAVQKRPWTICEELTDVRYSV